MILYLFIIKTPFFSPFQVIYIIILIIIFTCVYLITSALLHFTKNLQGALLETMGKKGKETKSDKSEMIPLFSNTTCSRDRGTMTWEVMYSLLE